LMMPDSFLPLKITFLLVGIWWIGFAQITFKRLPESQKSGNSNEQSIFARGFNELKLVWTQMIKMPALRNFLAAFFFYSMGVQTVMLVATDFGIKLLKLEDTKLILTLVFIQLVAIVGAIALSRLSEKWGNIRVLILTVLLWMGVCIAGYYTTTEYEFYILAILVGLVMGGIQSLSRSTYSKLMPVTRDTASFFSFFDITEKLAIVIGLFTFGYIEGITRNMRNSIISLIVFFVLGSLMLMITYVKRKKELGPNISVI
jgi:MFS transporter, UMF1 family